MELADRGPRTSEGLDAAPPQAAPQVATTLPGSGRLAISASREIEDGARGMLLLVEDLFRLDAQPSGDTLQLSARNLSSGEITLDAVGYGGAVFVQGGEIAHSDALRPGHFDAEVTIRAAGRATVTTIIIATERRPSRGSVRLTAQAVVATGADPSDAAGGEDGQASRRSGGL